MQKNLPKITFFLLIFLIGIVLILALFLKIKTQTNTIATEKITINSSIYPYTVKATPALEQELEKLNFWTNGTRFSTNRPKKLIININYMQPGVEDTASFRQTDKDGAMLIAGGRDSNPNGDPIINVFINEKVFSIPDQNPTAWIDSAFWNVFYGLTVGPVTSGGNTDNFMKEVLSQGDSFTITK